MVVPLPDWGGTAIVVKPRSGALADVTAGAGLGIDPQP